MSKKIYKINYTIGGAAAAEQDATMEENILTLYTTGLGNSLNAYEENETNQNILQYYKLYRVNIFKQILRNWSEIEIKHYDPLIIEEMSQENVDLQEANIKFIKDMCISEGKIEGIKSSEFYQEEFTEAINASKPHIILDFAHLFTYTADAEMQQIGITYRNQDGSPRNVYNLNILRFGFLGNVIPQALFRVDPLFIVDEGKKIVTLNKIFHQKLPLLIEENYLGHAGHANDPLAHFFEAVIRDGFETKGDLKRVNSVKHILANKLTVTKQLDVPTAEGIVQKNFESNIDLMTNICKILVDLILNNEFKKGFKLDLEGRIFLRDIIDHISSHVLSSLTIPRVHTEVSEALGNLVIVD